MAKKKTSAFPGYSPAQINHLNGIIPGGTGVQGVAGVKPTPVARPMPVPANPLKGITGANPTPITPSAQPVDPAVVNAELIGNRNVAIGKGEAAYQTGNLNFDYGYNPDGSLNTANPYSRAALYQLQYERNDLAAGNGLASRGLFGGAVKNAQNLNAGNYGQAEAANRLAYQRSLHGVQTGQLGTVANAGTGVSDNDFAALLRATYPGSS